MKFNDTETRNLEENDARKEKILLALLPYWTPQIPPLGIACLKSFLQEHGYTVTTVDANVDGKLRKIYNTYFDILREYMSEKTKRGSFYNLGHDVLQNHMMAHLNYQDKKEYIELVKILVYQTFYQEIDENQVTRLNKVLDEFYACLGHYFLNLVERENPDVLGLSVYKGTIPASMFVSQLVRKKYPHIRTVMGGAVFAQTLVKGTTDFEYFLDKTKDYIDKLFIGEGEILFLKYLQKELAESQRVYTLQDIDKKTLDLASVSIPDFSDLDLDFYPNLSAYTSRSCPFQCSFCTETVYWGKYRKKKVTRIVEELTQLYQKHGSQLFLMCDSLLNPVALDLAMELITSDISIYWDGYLRVDKQVCDPDTALLWRQGGLYRARLGVESGSQHVLDLMDKKISVDQIKSAIINLANTGIKTTTYWVIGHPGETEEDFQKTLDIIEELKDYIYEAHCNPFGYYLNAQVDSDQWAQKHKSIPLYPVNSREMVVIQTWRLDCFPTREETYSRLRRAEELCDKLGIPNPFSLYDIHKGDDRWRKLHKNAVPSLMEFKKNSSSIVECKRTQRLHFAQNSIQDEMQLGF